MRNRAKCRICNSIIESFHLYDMVSCACGEISISGGVDKYECSAKSFANFLRVDDEGNEILVKVVEKDSVLPEKESNELPVLSRKDKIEMLREMIKSIERLPQNAMNLPINHYDHCSALVVLLSILEES